ncbi:MAG: hypothetical protein AAF564_23065 [Bacteroidota bacterium]
MPIFAEQQLINITITANLDVLLADRGESPAEHAGTLVYTDDADAANARSSAFTTDIQLRVRGNFRKNEKHCNFPPLRLNFKKKAVAGSLFEGLDKVKLVTHCQDWEQAYNDRVILEYLAYQIYNVVTPFSFKVRLAEVTYVDSTLSRKPITRYGFLIEDDDDMATRNGGVISKVPLFHQDSTDAAQITVLSIFQYLIGNTDWSVTAQHNIRLVDVPGKEKVIPVPYDFDWSGLVNAPYATPAPNLRLETVRERRYRGYCRPIEDLQPHFDQFNAHREEIEALVDGLDVTSNRYRKQARQYIAQFYKDIDKSRRKKRAFLKFCRKG